MKQFVFAFSAAAMFCSGLVATEKKAQTATPAPAITANQMSDSEIHKIPAVSTPTSLEGGTFTAPPQAATYHLISTRFESYTPAQ
jgi:hypothetical protein